RPLGPDHAGRHPGGGPGPPARLAVVPEATAWRKKGPAAHPDDLRLVGLPPAASGGLAGTSPRRFLRPATSRLRPATASCRPGRGIFLRSTPADRYAEALATITGTGMAGSPFAVETSAKRRCTSSTLALSSHASTKVGASMP